MFLSAKKGDHLVGQIATGIVQGTYRGPRGGRYAIVLWDNGKMNEAVNLKGEVWPNVKARDRYYAKITKGLEW